MTASSDVAKPGWQDEKGNQIGYSHKVQNYQPGVNMSAPLQTIYDRGQARGDQAQGTLGAYGQAATQYGANASGYGGKAYDMGTSGSTQAYQAGQRLEGAGGQGGAIGNQYAGAIGKAGGMGMGEAYAAQQRLGQSADRMTGAADRLANLENTQGPSAAQAQLQMGLNKAQANNLAMARSGSGFGGSASRSTQALRQNAAMGQDAANSSAMLKASEDAAWRQRQAGNLGAAGGLYGGAGNLGAASGQLGLSATGQNLQAQGMAGQQALVGNAQNLQGIQGSGQLGLQGTALGLQGAQQGVQANQAGIQGVQAGGALQAQGFGLGMQGDQQAGQAIAQDQAAKQAYEQMLMQEYGIESGVGVQQAAATNAFYGGVIGGVAGATGQALSDERQKKVGAPVKMSSAIFGNPYGRRGAPGHISSVMSDERQKQAPSSEVTPLNGEEEDSFQRWAKSNHVSDVDDPRARYDYRGYWKESGGAPVRYGVDHFPDTYKQHGHETFSNESKYSRGGLDGGRWLGDDYVDLRPQNEALSGPSAVQRAYGQAPSLRDVPSYEYEYRDPSLPGAAPGRQTGPMAQDIERAIPGAVHDTPYGKQVDPGRTVLPLLSAVGEQQARIDKLEQRLGEAPDRRLAENERPKGEHRAVSDAPSGLSFEAYDSKGYGAPDPQSQAPSTTPGATMARRAVGTLGNALMEPVKMGARALRNVVDTRAVRNLDANEAVDQGESLVRDEPVAATRARRQAGEHAYGDWAAAGDVAGEIGAAGVQGGALRAAPAVEAEAARAFGGSRVSQRGVAVLDSPAPSLASLKEARAAAAAAGDYKAFQRAEDEISRLTKPAPSAAPKLAEAQTAAPYLGTPGQSAQDYLRSHPSAKALDEYLRTSSGGIKGTKHERALDNLLRDAQQAGHTRPGETYRGMALSKHELDAMLETGEVKSSSPWSTSSDPDVAKSFAMGRSDPKQRTEQVLFRVRGQSGVPVRGAGGSEHLLGEEEVLYRPGRWKVRSSERMPDGRTMVDVEEAAPRQDPGPYLMAHPEYQALDDYVGSSVALNRELREAGQGLPPRGGMVSRNRALEKADKIGRVLDDADKAGHSQAGTTYRGVDLPVGVADKWEKTGYVDNHTFWSSSKNEGKARGFSGEQADREPVLLRLHGNNGVPLGSAGLGGGVEEEVLFGRKKNWRVTGSSVGDDGVRIMDLEQVDSVPEGITPEVGALKKKSEMRYG